MNIEQQCCSLELAKRLRELDIKQGYSLFYWDDSSNTPRLLFYKELQGIHEKFAACECDYYSAFTAAELGEILPKRIEINGIYSFLTQIPSANLKYWCLFYRNDFSSLKGCETHDETEANARAKMLIYLIENKLIHFPDHSHFADHAEHT